ncbi:MAG: helix-turn-helix domain-containing protein [Gammaproteobacteria bacterium]|nr:helix-turn-helix domain-containing protein [Gammaproteobacteria bacterium]
MTKRNIGNEIIKGMETAIDYMRGKKVHVVVHKAEIPDEINVRAIRIKLKLTRQEFADRFGFSIRTLQHWEQGDRHPHGPARVLLLLLQRDPATIEGILKHTKKDRPKKASQRGA